MEITNDHVANKIIFVMQGILAHLLISLFEIIACGFKTGVKYMLKVKSCLVVHYLKMCDHSQGKSFFDVLIMCSFCFIICHVFGDGSYSKSFLIPWQDWFSSTTKSVKAFKVMCLPGGQGECEPRTSPAFSYRFWALPHMKQPGSLSNPGAWAHSLCLSVRLGLVTETLVSTF